MSPLLDQALVAMLIGLALLYFGISWWRRRGAHKGCGSGCGTPTKPLVKNR